MEPVEISDRIAIVAGVENGKKLRELAGIGHQTPGRYPGKVILKVGLAPHERFTHVADTGDLFTAAKITLHEAVFGLSRVFTYLDGKAVRIKLNAPIHNNQVGFI